MTDLLTVLTPVAVLSAITAGLGFGIALPWLFTRLTEGLIPEAQITVLNRAAGVLVPLLAIPLGLAFWLAQIVTEASAGGPWLRVLARFLLFVAFVIAVTVGDLVIQRFWRPQPTRRLDERIARIDAATTASEQRIASYREEQLVAERVRQTQRRLQGMG